MYTIFDICDELKVSVNDYRSFAAAVPKVRRIPTKGSKRRVVHIPPEPMRKPLRRLATLFKNQLQPAAAVHSFQAGKSPYSCAAPHVGRPVLIRFDLKDFYHQIKHAQILETLLNQGFETEAAAVTADVTTVSYGRRRVLPQGFSTSPTLSNAALHPVDAYMTLTALEYDWVYTRYADDMYFSGYEHAGTLYKLVEARLRACGLVINRRKSRVYRGEEPHVVAGCVVGPDPQMKAPRELWRRLRAMVHNVAHGKSAWSDAWGLATYLARMDADFIEPYMEQLRSLRDE
jgi:RNA-directed DNA polymerase